MYSIRTVHCTSGSVDAEQVLSFGIHYSAKKNKYTFQIREILIESETRSTNIVERGK